MVLHNHRIDQLLSGKRPSRSQKSSVTNVTQHEAASVDFNQEERQEVADLLETPHHSQTAVAKSPEKQVTAEDMMALMSDDDDDTNEKTASFTPNKG